MQHLVDLSGHVDVVGDVGADQPERRVLEQVRNVAGVAREEGVEPDGLVPVGKEALAS